MQIKRSHNGQHAAFVMIIVFWIERVSSYSVEVVLFYRNLSSYIFGYFQRARRISERTIRKWFCFVSCKVMDQTVTELILNSPMCKMAEKDS